MITVYKPGAYMVGFDESTAEGIVIDPTSCAVENNINGAWSLILVHPTDPLGRYKWIQPFGVLRVPTWQDEPQFYRIMSVSTSEFEVTAEAVPIFYDAGRTIFHTSTKVYQKTALQALKLLFENPQGKGWYTAEADGTYTDTSSAYFVGRTAMDCLCGDEEPTFLGRWGGELEFDNFKIRYHKEMNCDTSSPLRIERGVNIPYDSVSVNYDASNIINRIYPVAFNGRKFTGDFSADWYYWEDGDENEYLTPGPGYDGDGTVSADVSARCGSGYINSPNIQNSPRVYSAQVTFSSVRHEDDVTADSGACYRCEGQGNINQALAYLSDMYFASTKCDEPQFSISVDYVDLYGLEPYKNISGLPHPKLGNAVRVIDDSLGIDVTGRITQIVYDSVRDCVESIVIGNRGTDFYDRSKSYSDAIAEAKVSAGSAYDEAQTAVNEARAMLSRVQGGRIASVPIPAKGMVNFTVTYNTAFTGSAPAVVLGINGTPGNSTAYMNVQMSVTGNRTTGFDVRFTNNNSVQVAPSFYWIATARTQNDTYSA